MKFTKLQSAGNDFILIEATDRKQDWAKLSISMCQRNFGIGADGLLLLVPSEKADLGMRIFNADGTEAEACGNGLRCLIKYAADKGLFNTKAETVTVETIAGLRQAKLTRQNGIVNRIQAGMGSPEFKATKIPVDIETDRGNIVDIKLISDYPIAIDDKELQLSFVAMGNPHAIYFQKQPVGEFLLSTIGPLVENHIIFPQKTNFEVVRIVNRKLIEMRVWERGVGETLACGSGACAVAVAGQLLGYVDNPVSIKLPGGTLEVDWGGSGEVLLSGFAEIVFDGEWLGEQYNLRGF